MSPDRDDRGPADDEYEDAEYAEEEPRSIFATTWFRAVLVVVVLAVVGVLALPYLLDWVGPLKLSPTVKGPGVTVPSPPLGSAAAPPAGAPPAPPAAPGAATPPAEPTVQMTPAAAEPKPELPPAAAPAPAAQAPAKAARGTAPGAKPENPTKTASSDHARAMSAEPAPKTARAADGAKTAARPAVKPAVKASAKPKALAAAGGPFWIQVGAFRDESSAKALLAKLRADDFSAEEVGPSEAPAAAAEPAAPASGGGDKYDVFVSGASSDDVNAKLAGKGLSADGVAGGAVVKPSLPLRDAVALSKDLATEGMKVQVRRATPAAPEKATARAGTGGGDRLYRVRVGSFPDRGTAETARKALAAKGYSGFIVRGGG
jgi:cell division septation protein DedD